jgi:hypothetical protein
MFISDEPAFKPRNGFPQKVLGYPQRFSGFP